jgi:hypothetical protein
VKPAEYWDRQCNPLASDRWIELLTDAKYRHVAEYANGNLRVLTEWLGFERERDHAGRPLIFRTLVYVDGTIDDVGGWYATEPEAGAGHVKVCMRREGRLP